MKKIWTCFVNGITSDNVFKRILFLYGGFFTVFILVVITSHFIFPEGFFK